LEKIIRKRDLYSRGNTCYICGERRSNKSKSLCQKCNEGSYIKKGRDEHGRFANSATRMPIVVADGPCVHHWVYPPPNGPVSVGYCRRCGAENESHNSLVFEQFRLGSQPRKGKKKNPTHGYAE